MTTKVVNKYKDRFDVYIGRGSIWGNPYTVADHGRDYAIILHKKKFLLDVYIGAITKEQLLTLTGKTLGCFCKPKSCHGDIIALMADSAYLNNHKETARLELNKLGIIV